MIPSKGDPMRGYRVRMTNWHARQLRNFYAGLNLSQAIRKLVEDEYLRRLGAKP